MTEREMITSTETSHDTFYAYRTDVEGPFVVELVISSHESNTRPVIADSFRVIVNGEHRWAGFASHLPENGPERLGGFVRIEERREEQGRGMTNTQATEVTWIVFSRLSGRTIHHCKRLEEALALAKNNWALLVDQHVEGDNDGPAL